MGKVLVKKGRVPGYYRIQHNFSIFLVIFFYLFLKKCGVGNLQNSPPRPATKNVHLCFSYTQDVAILKYCMFIPPVYMKVEVS